MGRSSAVKAIVLAWLIVGILDLTSAVIIAETQGHGTLRMLQGIASGLLGKSSFEGGWVTAGLGFVIHFFIALVVTSIFYFASRSLTALQRHPVVSGLLYGIAVYLFMYWVVIPLVFPTSHHSISRDVTAVFVHMFLIGLPASLIIQRQSRLPASMS